MKTKSSSLKKSNQEQTVLQRIDLFIGHLKTPFEAKPGFFIHDLLFVLIAAKELFNLWSVGKHFVHSVLAMSHNTEPHLESGRVITVSLVFFSLLIEIFLVYQLWKFVRKTKFSLLLFAAVSWSAIFTSILIFVSQYISTAYYNHNGFKIDFDAGGYLLNLLPWLLFYCLIIFLCSRKKIIVMHKVSRKNFLFTPLYGLIWMIIVQGVQMIVALIYNLMN